MLAPELLKLFYLVSPALPVGAYAYSQGQEYAVDSGWIASKDDLTIWLRGVLHHSVGTCDLPLLPRFYKAWQNNDIDELNKWNNFLIATRETKELLLEDSQLGIALARVLEGHSIDRHQVKMDTSPSYSLLFALAGVTWDISSDSLMQGFVWSWLENQVAAATKTIPLGQTQAQQVLMSLIEDIPEVVNRAQSLNDDELGQGLPALALASSLHERQYSRLFRS